jgi:RND family efflux transporter MFP subunit
VDDLVFFFDPDREFGQGHGAPSVARMAGSASLARRGGLPIKPDLETLRIDRGPRSGRGRGRALGLGGAVVLLLISAGAGWWLLGSGRRVEVRTVTVREEAAAGAGPATVLNASGYVTARRRATVASKVTGRLVEVPVEEGLPVRAGDVLARLDDSQARAALALAESRVEAARRSVEETEAQLALARITLARTRRLADAGVAQAEQLDRDATGVETLEARVSVEHQAIVVAEREASLRRTELEEMVIRAPFDGVVVSKDAQTGEMVSPMSAGGGFTRTGICTLVDMSSLEIEVDVNESYISRVHAGQAAEAVLDAYPEWRIPARVITTIPAADRQKATVLVRIGFEALDPRILPDMGIQVAFRQHGATSANEVERRFAVPRSALRRDNGRDVVYLVRDGRVERRAITVVAVRDEEVLVGAGLSSGERVIVAGPEHLVAGDRVNANDQTEERDG